jgi:hypothetical protein
MIWTAMAGALALSGCAAATIDGPPPEPLGLTVNSWGKPLFEWTINPDGSGTYTYADDTGAKDFRDYKRITKRLAVGTEGHAQIAALLAPARRYAGAGLPCERSITDMPYGEIRFGAPPPRTVKYDLGCRSGATGPVHAGLTKAQDRMIEWAKGAPVIETRQAQP